MPQSNTQHPTQQGLPYQKYLQFNLNLSMRRLIRSLAYSYQIIKKTNGPRGAPLPDMDIFYLGDDQGEMLSFWNDLPFDLEGDTLTCCIEVPKEFSNKYEVIKEKQHHPLMQDTRTNAVSKQLELRHYARLPLFNYGFIPRTWEQNLTKNELGLYGDDDPIDICDLSKGRREVGSIFKAKVLGCFCLIDQGELDWKILTVDAAEAKQENINNISDYPRQRMQALMEWFKVIKTFDGKPANSIAYNEKIFSKDETLEIVSNTHQEWRKLVESDEEVYRELREKFAMGELRL